MNILLKLKHWQLFAISWGSGILLNLFAVLDPFLVLKLFPLAMLLFVFGTFGWIWAIATGLHPLLPSGTDLNIRKFKILFSIPVIYILLLCLGLGVIMMGDQQDALSGMGGLTFIIILLHLLSMVCIFYGMRFAAKTLRAVELGRPVKFSDYAGEFFLLWFSIIGYWVIQPRINRLAGNSNTAASVSEI
ncbi:hypothetical protein [Nafulsella turpanensis]|uniref:hypothetical protein n=1 Tax=Nafulsella turpanensis TaxID=1265690 RepID=UPI00034840FB|nr:hypothetical protein [Nafulsella turpanensis]